MRDKLAFPIVLLGVVIIAAGFLFYRLGEALRQREPDSFAQTEGAQPLAEEEVNKYLEKNVGLNSFKSNGSKEICVHYNFRVGRPSANLSEREQYMWALCEEFYVENGKIEPGSGESLPVVLKIGKGNTIVGHEIPGDGSLYSEDIKRMFPKDLHAEIFEFSSTSKIQELIKLINSQFIEYFKQRNIEFVPMQ